MARKVFISVLGTTFYQNCQYMRGDCGFVSSPCKFIQCATLEYLFSKETWTSGDRVFVLMTEKAKQMNWDVSRRKNPHSKSGEVDYKGLKDSLAEMDMVSEVQAVDIKEGKDETELWDIFSTIFNLLEENDTLYFDLTHGFRYLPMLVLVLGNYTRFLKHTEIASITYGNFEATDSHMKSLMDLMPLAMLQRWTFAAADFTENGNAQSLVDLSLTATKMMLREESIRENTEKKDGVQNLRFFVNAVARFNSELRFCRGKAICDGKSVGEMRDYAKLCQQEIIHPFHPVIREIIGSTHFFSDQWDVQNCLRAARWCLDKGQYQAAGTQLQEGIVTLFCKRHGINVSDSKRRELINKAFCKVKDPQTYRYSLDRESEELVDRVAIDPLFSREAVEMFGLLTDVRNDFNHAGWRKDCKDAAILKKNLCKVFSSFENLFSFADAVPPILQNEPKAKSGLLVNLSNHPSSEWEVAQYEAAKAYGEGIQDIAFPDIDPQADISVVEDLAAVSVNQILQLCQSYRVTVHVMGEMTFTCAVVRRLQAKGVPCVASTSRRDVRSLSDGSKHVIFHFEKFRSYGQ